MSRYPLVAMSVICLASLASARAADDPNVALRQTIEKRFPGVKVESIAATPIPNIYEVFTGDSIVYSDQSGEYLVAGNLIETRTRRDLSAQRMEEFDRVDFEKLPFDRAIKIVKGNGRRQFALFADPDCPYCQGLEKELVGISDVTIYVFLYPLTTVHPDADAHARAIWCAPDRGAAWTAWMLDRKRPPTANCSGTPIEELQNLGKSLHILSTPTLFLPNGHRLKGAPKAAILDAMLGPPSAPDGNRPTQPVSTASADPAIAAK